MATQTGTQLIASIRELANVQNNNFVTDAELLKRINEAIQEFYDLVLSVYENYFKVYSNSFTLAGGQTGNSVAVLGISGVSSFYKDNTLEWNPGTSNMRIVRRLPSQQERDSASGRTYEIIGTPPVLYVYPPEESAGVYRLGYTPDAPVLASASDSLDTTLNKWFEYILLRVAIYVHRKRDKLQEALTLAGSENDPQPGTLAYVRKNVLTMARNRQEQPQQVPLGRRRGSFWDWDDSV